MNNLVNFYSAKVRLFIYMPRLIMLLILTLLSTMFLFLGEYLYSFTTPFEIFITYSIINAVYVKVYKGDKASKKPKKFDIKDVVKLTVFAVIGVGIVYAFVYLWLYCMFGGCS